MGWKAAPGGDPFSECRGDSEDSTAQFWAAVADLGLAWLAALVALAVAGVLVAWVAFRAITHY
jgi:hypothetical protein